MRRPATRLMALGLTVNLAVAPAVSAAPTAASTGVQQAGPAPARPPAAETAYREGFALLQAGEHRAAVLKLDLAIELAPRWSDPVRARAQAFAALAERDAPSEVFLRAQAADVERLLVLEPGVETASRQQQVLALHKEAAAARDKESRRRKLAKPAMIVITLNVATLTAGALMLAFIPLPTGYDAVRHQQYVTGASVLTAVGVAMLPASITLGVLAGRQSRRDSRAADFNVESGRRGPVLGVAPQFVPGGGGAGLSLRF